MPPQILCVVFYYEYYIMDKIQKLSNPNGTRTERQQSALQRKEDTTEVMEGW